jgi:hypothetical protein
VKEGMEVGRMNTRQQRFQLFQGKSSFPRKQIYTKIPFSYSKWSIRKIVMITSNLVETQIYNLVSITGYKFPVILHEKWNNYYSTCSKLE